MKNSKLIMVFVIALANYNYVNAQSILQTNPANAAAPTGLIKNNVMPDPIYVNGIIYVGNGVPETNINHNTNIAFGAPSPNMAPNNGYGGVSSQPLGQLTLLQTSTGQANTAIGSGALVYNKIAGSNTAIGTNALYFTNADGASVDVNGLSGGNNNTGVGNSALQNNIGGSSNTAVGFEALALNVSGYQNVAVGQALGTNVSGYQNSALGFGALARTNGGIGNTAMGYMALNGVTSGNYNVAIGYNASVANNAASNQLSIQNVIYGTNMGLSNTSVGITTAPVSFNGGTNFAKLYVGGGNTTTDPSLQLKSVPATTSFPIANPNSLSNNFLYVDANGVVKQSPLPSANISATCSTPNSIPMWGASNALGCSIIQQSSSLTSCTTGTHSGIGIGGAPIATTTSGTTCYDLTLTVYGSAFASGGLWIASDKKFKTGIQKIESAIDKITKLRGVSYSFDSKNFPEFKFPTGRTLGFIAQELKEVIPEAVSYTEKGFYAVNYDVLIPVLTEGIKEQQTQIESLQQQIEELKAMVNKLASGNIQKSVATDFFEIQPNPVTQTSNVSYKLLDASAKAAFVVYDLQGKMLKQIDLPVNAKEGQVQLSKSDLPKGAYILSLVKGNIEVQSKRFLIME